MIESRSYRERDRQAVTAIILPIEQQEFGIAINAADQPDLQDIRGFYQSGNGGFWVACHQGEVVGTVGLKDIGGGRAALSKMFVKSGYRGAPLLVAAGLLDQARTHASTHRICDIYLGTTNQFISAQHFYRKQGFSAITRDDLPAAFPLMAVDSLFFHRYRRNNARGACDSAHVAAPSAKVFPCLTLDEGLLRCKTVV